MRSVFRFIFYVFLAGISAVGVGFASFLAVLYFFSSDLPDHSSLKKYIPDLTSRVYLQDGTKLCEYSDERRYFIPIERIPDKLINAFIAVEDKNFFNHVGIDLRSIARSLIVNLKNIKTNKRPKGGSTITQQVARIFLIKTNEVSYLRKLKEAILSFRIENTLSKNQILELYLNQIYMGLGTYGVATAAKVYFDKTVNELTIAECSYLASLAKGANNYHPVKYYEKALERRNWAIKRQLEEGYITEEEAENALKEDLKMVPQEKNSFDAEYFAEEIRKDLISKYPQGSLNKKGLIIRCTLNPDLQACASNVLKKCLENLDHDFGWRGSLTKINTLGIRRSRIVEMLREIPQPKAGKEFLRSVVTSTYKNTPTILTETNEEGNLSEADFKWTNKTLSIGDVILTKKQSDGTFALKQIPEVQGAIVVIEANSGRVLAMQGGYSFDESEFNRAVTAERQCGSVIKPFVYLTALNNGFAPNSIIDASPIEIDLGGKLGIWKPKNFNDKILDKITLRLALKRSVNTATVRLAQEIGIPKIAKTVELFGIFDHMPRFFSYVLGAGDTTLMKLTVAYAMLANGGRKITPTMIDYIQDRYGNIVFNADQREVDNSIGFDEDQPPKLHDNRKPIINERSIYQITSLLYSPSDQYPGLSFACKTGTSNKARDTWCIGYTPDIAVGVFVGFDDHSRSLGEKAQGAVIARPIIVEFLSQARKYLQPKPFRVPKGIHLRKINLETGELSTKNGSSTIIEAFKDEDDQGSRRNILMPQVNRNNASDANAIGKSSPTKSSEKPPLSALLGIF